MKKLFLLPAIVLAVSLLCGSCSKDDDDDTTVATTQWKAEGWESSAKYNTCNVKGMEYINVPTEGGTYVFRCKEKKPIKFAYNYFEVDWRDSFGFFSEFKDGDSKTSSFSYAWYHCKVEGDSVIIKFDSNKTENDAKFNVEVNCGGKFLTFRFLQKTSYQRNQDFVGDWILDTDKYKGELSVAKYRLTLNEDGTFYSGWERKGGEIDDICNNFSGRAGEIGGNYQYNSVFWTNSFIYGFITTNKPTIRGNKLVLTDSYGNEYEYVRVSDYNGSCIPIYDFHVNSTISAFGRAVHPGETYTLNWDLVAQGKKYTFNSMKLSCHVWNVDDSEYTEDIDLKNYMNKDNGFCIERVAPKDAKYMECIWTFRGTYQQKTDKGIVDVPFELYKSYGMVVLNE